VTVLGVSQGYDGSQNQLLSSEGQLDEWQSSDDRRGRLDHGRWTSLDFNNSSSILGSEIRLVRFCVEYAIDPGINAGSILWQARTGSLASPTRLSGVDPADDATTAPRVIYTRNGDATACWDADGTLFSALQADPSRVNSLLLVLRNNDANTNLFVDSVAIVVEWAPR
jgi:hypothetical protein